jgi:oligosaccharyltransferase complex subunit gamma
LKLLVITTTVLGAITFIAVAAPYVKPVIQNRNLWAAFSLIAVLLFTSGQMFNHIRHTAYAAGDASKGVTVFAGGFQNQYGLETQIIAGICMSHNPDRLDIPFTYADFFVIRWRPGLCYYHPRRQSPQDRRREAATGRCALVGSRHILNVQLPAQHLQVQERRLPILPATFLNVLSYSNARNTMF